MTKDLIKLAFDLGYKTALEAKAQPTKERQPKQEKTAGQKLFDKYAEKLQAKKQAAEAPKKDAKRLVLERMRSNKTKSCCK